MRYGQVDLQRAYSNIHIIYIYVPLEKGLATHSSVLAWRIPWIEECVCMCVYIYVYIYMYIYIYTHIHTNIGYAAQHARSACGILVPQPGIKPMLSAVEARSLTNWTLRETPSSCQRTCLFPPHTCQHVIIKSFTI